MKHLIIAAFCVLIETTALIAGEPIEETERCPFGGESVTYTGTAGCSSYGSEVKMSLAPVTSCDFIERMPQCPKSKLPLYRAFTREEIKVLRDFSRTDAYSKAAAISRFYLAYVIEKELSPENTGDQLDLLVKGLWYDPNHTYSNTEYFRAFSDTMNQYTPTAPQEEKDFLRAVGAYGLVHRGNTQKAKEIIAAIRKSPAAKGTWLLFYVGLLEKCMANPKAEKCSPDYEVSIPE